MNNSSDEIMDVPSTKMVPTIKQVLRRRFGSDTKFYVRSQRRGTMITVSWIGGPSVKAVRDEVRIFDGAEFDGNTDTWLRRPVAFGHGLVQWGANYISCDRMRPTDM